MLLNAIVSSRERVFWLVQSSAWLAYVGAAYLGALAHEKPQSYLDVLTVTAAAGFVITVLMRYAYRALWYRSPVVLIIGSFLICYSMALVWRLISNNLYWSWVKSDWHPETWLDQISGVMSSFYVFACWTGLYFGVKYYQQFQDQTKQTLKATAAAHQAQLKMLRYQLNPHFLFNTLNAISTLILDRANETANQTVTRLSSFLRYTLDKDPNIRVTLRQELEAIDLYLEIEKVRFGERLVVSKEIETAALDALVPSLMLQPLVENAIKYAITPREEGGTIRIGAKVHNETLSMTVADDGPGMKVGSTERKKSCGVGLKNTRERLQQLYGEKQAFTLAANVPKGLIATINIPYAIR